MSSGPPGIAMRENTKPAGLVVPELPTIVGWLGNSCVNAGLVPTWGLPLIGVVEYQTSNSVAAFTVPERAMKILSIKIAEFALTLKVIPPEPAPFPPVSGGEVNRFNCAKLMLDTKSKATNSNIFFIHSALVENSSLKNTKIPAGEKDFCLENSKSTTAKSRKSV